MNDPSNYFRYEILEILNRRLESGKIPDGISTIMLVLLNLSIKTYEIPNIWKMAKIIPFFKPQMQWNPIDPPRFYHRWPNWWNVFYYFTSTLAPHQQGFREYYDSTSHDFTDINHYTEKVKSLDPIFEKLIFWVMLTHSNKRTQNMPKVS